MRNKIIIFLALLNALLLQAIPAHSKTPQTVMDMQETVVSVYVKDNLNQTVSSGTGFIVNSSGLIVTNFHVIEGKLANPQWLVIIKTYNGSYFILQDIP